MTSAGQIHARFNCLPSSKPSIPCVRDDGDLGRKGRSLVGRTVDTETHVWQLEVHTFSEKRAVRVESCVCHVLKHG